MMEIVDIVNCLRLNIHNILEAGPATIFMRNGAVENLQYWACWKELVSIPGRETFFSLISPEDEGESSHWYVIRF